MLCEGIEVLRHETETTWFSKKAIPSYLKLLKRIKSGEFKGEQMETMEDRLNNMKDRLIPITYNTIMLKRIVLLKSIVNKYWDVKKSEVTDFEKLNTELKANGITAKMKSGEVSDFYDVNTMTGRLNSLEWFLGSYVDMFESGEMLGWNSWYNMKKGIIEDEV